MKKTIVAVRGPKPTAALRSRGVRIDRSAADPFTTQELLAAIADLALEGERVVVQRHGAVNVELDRALEARGARVLEIPTYRWALPQDTAPLAALIDALERGDMHAVVLTNAEQVRNLFAVAERLGRAQAAARRAQPHPGRLDRPGRLGGVARGGRARGARVEPAQARSLDDLP